ncbi:hypothetical protein N7468_005226 [Penicillium chermesinum]|uniref:Uncharacterized protein n=1 Tax=Penicillium chermesinum TaxID=63820 RepID=A0A9W9TMT4_9EURO|nr:uncharacterized protein N7468_005226 [Penicillium chermesinum]KAJ5232270.1 hypothetical protein N7468_005226 [Penicillium chermesinum]KAJ6171924.1 hypothetical protein N7470_000991 [Penicillium chermesinum]
MTNAHYKQPHAKGTWVDHCNEKEGSVLLWPAAGPSRQEAFCIRSTSAGIGKMPETRSATGESQSRMVPLVPCEQLPRCDRGSEREKELAD